MLTREDWDEIWAEQDAWFDEFSGTCDKCGAGHVEPDVDEQRMNVEIIVNDMVQHKLDDANDD